MTKPTGRPRGRTKPSTEELFARKMKVGELNEAIRDACKSLGLILFSLRSDPLKAGSHILIVGTTVLFACVLPGTQQPSSEEWGYGGAFAKAGQQWRVWQPRDWVSGEIQAELAKLAGQTMKGRQ